MALADFVQRYFVMFQIFYTQFLHRAMRGRRPAKDRSNWRPSFVLLKIKTLNSQNKLCAINRPCFENVLIYHLNIEYFLSNITFWGSDSFEATQIIAHLHALLHGYAGHYCFLQQQIIWCLILQHCSVGISEIHAVGIVFTLTMVTSHFFSASLLALFCVSSQEVGLDTGF